MELTARSPLKDNLENVSSLLILGIREKRIVIRHQTLMISPLVDLKLSILKPIVHVPIQMIGVNGRIFVRLDRCAILMKDVVWLAVTFTSSM